MLKSWSGNLRLLSLKDIAVGGFHVCDSEQDKNLDYKLVQTKLMWSGILPCKTQSPG